MVSTKVKQAGDKHARPSADLTVHHINEKPIVLKQLQSVKLPLTIYFNIYHDLSAESFSGGRKKKDGQIDGQTDRRIEKCSRGLNTCRVSC